MLVLSRKLGEKIIITPANAGEKIEVVLVAIRDDGKVRIGIHADRATTVHRAEVQAAVERKTDASNHTPRK